MHTPTCEAKIKNTRYKVKKPYVPKKPPCSKVFCGIAHKRKKYKQKLRKKYKRLYK